MVGKGNDYGIDRLAKESIAELSMMTMIVRTRTCTRSCLKSWWVLG